MASIQAGINQLVGIGVGAVKTQQQLQQKEAEKQQASKDKKMADKALKTTVAKINAIYSQGQMTQQLREAILIDVISGKVGKK